MKNIVKLLCIDCKDFKEIPHVIDIFPYDKKKCTKFVNNTFRQEGLSPETTVFYQTTFMARYSEELCGDKGKHFSSKFT